MITLTGSVRALRSLLEAPLSGQLCVAFYSASTVTGGSNDLHPDKIVMRQMTPFDLVTAEGVVRIDGTSADLAHPTRPNVPRDLARETAFLVAHGFNAELVSTSHFQEAVVIEGDTVRVQGLAVVERAPPNDAQGYRENERSIRLVAYGAHPLTIGPASPA
ncbi:MAG: hypothetical protein ACKV2T_18440 [Kofleriaceae bacterium]